MPIAQLDLVTLFVQPFSLLLSTTEPTNESLLIIYEQFSLAMGLFFQKKTLILQIQFSYSALSGSIALFELSLINGAVSPLVHAWAVRFALYKLALKVISVRE